MRIFVSLAATFLLVACRSTPAPLPQKAADPTSTAACAADAGWNDPAAPQHLYGNTWYVGTCGISALLVTSPQGHVLVDTGTDKAASFVEANILALGFKLEDIKYILNSHDHNDHAGGLAQLQRDTGATVLAGAASVQTLQRGASDRSDPQFLITGKFPPVAKVQAIQDGEVVKLGPLEITAHATPGHTPGSTSWSWTSCEGEQCIGIVYADSVSAISDDEYRYSDEADHPGVVAAFRQSLDTLDGLYCSLLVTTHPSASQLWTRLGPHASQPLIQPGACHAYAENGRKNLQARLQQEQGKSSP